MSLRVRPRALVSMLSCLALTFGALLAVEPAGAAGPTTQGVGPDSLVTQSIVPVDDRMTDYTLTTPDLPRSTVARVMLPTGYAASPAKRYPVLYLLPGCCDAGIRQSRWSDPSLGDAERLTAGLDVIVVMPEGDLGSMYTDWSSAGTQGQYPLGELPRGPTCPVGRQFLPDHEQPVGAGHRRIVDGRLRRAGYR